MTRRLASRLRARLFRFRDETSGNIAIEALILLPILFWAYLAMFSYFDMLRQQSLNQKASYTVADMLSRETREINGQYVTNANALFRSMIRSDDTTGMRISVLKWDEDADRFDIMWSEARGPATALSTGQAQGMNDRLPLMPSGEEVILVETWTDYRIPFEIGMKDFEMNTFTFVRPRFTSQLKWEDADA